jgi:hypothetical protein
MYKFKTVYQNETIYYDLQTNNLELFVFYLSYICLKKESVAKTCLKLRKFS